jgi:hypothetical protein
MLVKKLESNTVGEDKYLVTLDIRDTATKIGVDSRIVLDALLGYDPQVTYYGTLSSSEYFKGLSEQCQTLPENYKRAFKLDDIVLRLSEKAIRLDATKSIVTVSIIVSNTAFVGDLTHPDWTLVPAIAKIDSNEVDTYLFGGEDRRFGAYSYDPELYRYKLLGFDLLTESTIFLGTKYPAAEEPKYHIKTCDFGFGVKVHFAILPKSLALTQNTGYIHVVTIDGTLVGRHVGGVGTCNMAGAIDAINRIMETVSDNPSLTSDMIHRLSWLTPETQSVSWYNSTLGEVEYKKIFKFTKDWLINTNS